MDTSSFLRVILGVKKMFKLLNSAFKNQKLLIELALRDITSSYSGSVLGSAWVLVDPIINIVLTLFFFQFAMKGSATTNVPYVVWVLPVIIFWTFISMTVNSTVSSVREYGYLLRHSAFDMRLVVIIKILGAGLIHISLLIMVLIALWIIYDINLGLRTLALIYYLLSMGALLLALGWIISSLGVFWKDIRNIVSIVLQIEFWVSPVFWEPDRFPRFIEIIMYANPFYYPMHGYRNAILGIDFGNHFWLASSYFWLVCAMLLLAGNYLFIKLSREFGDVV